MNGPRRFGNDPFELHKLQTEANIKRMKQEHRLNSKSPKLSENSVPGNMEAAKSIRASKITKSRKPLQQLTNNTMNIAPSRPLAKPISSTLGSGTDLLKMIHNRRNKATTISSDFPKKVSKPTNMSDMIKNLHKQAQPSKAGPSIPVSQVVALAENTKPVRSRRYGLNNRYSEITEEIIDILPEQHNDPLVQQNSDSVRSLIEWFKVHRYNYVAVCPSLTQLQADIQRKLGFSPNSSLSIMHNGDSSNNGASKEKSTQEIQETNNAIPESSSKHNLINPTHIVRETRKLGKFLQSVKIQSVTSKKLSFVFLTRMDVRFSIKTNDLLVLTGPPSSLQNIHGSIVPVFSRWQILMQAPLDVDFFAH